MSYAIRCKIRADNPCKGIEKYGETKRKRYFTEAELMAIAHELEVSPAQDGCDVIRLCMLTGCRVGEALKAKFDHFDLHTSLGWSKPASTTKQNQDHHVPLSPDAIALVKKWRRLANGDDLFPARWKSSGHMPPIRAL